MILRNLNVSLGLCNGTILRVIRLAPNVIEGIILNGNHKGSTALIPRITLHAPEGKTPFTLRRHQFPVVIAYAMTVNKSQSQSLDRVGIYLKTPVFAHGQIYVAFSRATNSTMVRAFIPNSNRTVNIVQRQILW